MLLTVAHQPGDNHRVAAVAVEPTGLEALNNNNVPASDEQVEGFRGKLSPLLTVWRKLHLDLDSMGNITGNLVTGTVVGVEHLPGHNPPWTKLTLSDFPDNFDEDQHFRTQVGPDKSDVMLYKEGVGDTEWMLVRWDEVHPGGDDDIIYVDLDTSLSAFVGGTYSLRDDDWKPTPDLTLAPVELPCVPNVGVLETALREAYVTVHVYDQQVDSTFRVNAEDEDDAEENLSGTGANGTSEWWVAHMTAAFQGKHAQDRDGGSGVGEDWEKGITDRDVYDVGDGAFVFLETMREFADSSRGDFELLVGETLAHEVGHQFGMNHQPDGPSAGWRGDYNGLLWLMAGEADFDEHHQDLRDQPSFDPPSINDIRSIDHPIEDAP